MPSSRSAAVGFFHDIMNTVNPWSTSQATSEFFGERSRM